jgi:hypothetical protein
MYYVDTDTGVMKITDAADVQDDEIEPSQCY